MLRYTPLFRSIPQAGFPRLTRILRRQLNFSLLVSDSGAAVRIYIESAFHGHEPNLRAVPVANPGADGCKRSAIVQGPHKAQLIDTAAPLIRFSLFALVKTYSPLI